VSERVSKFSELYLICYPGTVLAVLCIALHPCYIHSTVTTPTHALTHIRYDVQCRVSR
jgi:hypothetical protein